MALITLPVGNVLVPWIGPTTTLAGQSWFTTTNLAGIYKPSTNRQGFTSSIPGAGFPGFTQVVSTAPGAVPEAYLFVVKVPFTLDSSLIGQPLVQNSLTLVVLPSQTATLNTYTIISGEEGSYLIQSSTGITSPAYSKNGTAVTTLSTTVPVTLAVGDTFGLTATTGGAQGILTLIKQ